MVFGIYAVDNDHQGSRLLRQQVAAFVRRHPHVISFHALYIHPSGRDIYVDLVVDYDLRDWDALRKEFSDYMMELYPDKHLELVIETNFV